MYKSDGGSFKVVTLFIFLIEFCEVLLSFEVLVVCTFCFVKNTSLKGHPTTVSIYVKQVPYLESF